MTDTDHTDGAESIDDRPAGDDAAPDGGADVESPGDTTVEVSLDEALLEGVGRKLTLAAIAILAVLAAYAVYQVYASTSRAIAIWFSADFVPVFEAVFNVIVFLVAVAGIVYLVREVA